MRTLNIVFHLRNTEIAPNEGLIVLLGDLIGGMHSCHVRCRIICARRHVTSVQEALLKNGIAPHSYDIDAKVRSPGLMRLYEIARGRRRTRRTAGRWYAYARLAWSQFKVANDKIQDWLAGLGFFGAIFAFLLLGLSAAVLGGVAAVAVAPLLLIWALYTYAARQVVQIISRVRRRFDKSVLGRLMNRARSWPATMLDRAYKAEAHRVARAINDDATIDRVLVPFAFSGHLVGAVASAKKLLVFPDAVTLMFPTRFIASHDPAMLSQFRKSLSAADGIICYSQWVVDNQLKVFFKDEILGKPIAVIPQGFLTDDARMTDLSPVPIRFTNFFPQHIGYIPDYELTQVNYLVYPSVDRPHKNMTSVIRAVEHLIRNEHRDIKFLTTSHAVGADAMELVARQRLFLDCLYAPSLSRDELDYVLRNAKLVIHSSLAEGGDIFNFSRGVSRGVPVLMADISVVREMFDRYGVSPERYQSWLFDPRNHLELAGRIADVLENREAILKAQQEVLAELSAYDNSAMAARYATAYFSVGTPEFPGSIYSK